MGSISSGTMRPEDLIPKFVSELEYQMRNGPLQSHETRKAQYALVREINRHMEGHDVEEGEPGTHMVVSESIYYASEVADWDLESLFDALNCYAAPYFYFGAHPGDGSDYGYWLSEDWDENFAECPLDRPEEKAFFQEHQIEGPTSIKVSDLSDIPSWFRGEVAVVNDHGNVSLYVKTSRTLREVWSVV
jgi:hypothetical protein